MAVNLEKKREYNRLWRQSAAGKESAKISSKKFRGSQKGKEWFKNYRQDPQTKEWYAQREQSLEHKEARRMRRSSPEGKEVKKRWWKDCLNSWVEKGIIPRKTVCEECGDVLVFNSGNLSESIHFDHRNGGNEPIKGSPFKWLQCHAVTDENIAIWKSCNFGMLCNECNLLLPTLGRFEWLIRLIKYVTNGKYELRKVG